MGVIVLRSNETISETTGETINHLVKEAKILILLFVILLVLFQIIFYKENILITLKTISSFYWLFVLPGFYSLYYWHNKLIFLERFIIGMVLSFAFVGLFSYYLNLYNFHIKYYALIVPLFVLFVNATIIALRINKEKQPKQLEHSAPKQSDNLLSDNKDEINSEEDIGKERSAEPSVEQPKV